MVIGNFELNQLLEQDGVDLVPQENQEEQSNSDAVFKWIFYHKVS